MFGEIRSARNRFSLTLRVSVAMVALGGMGHSQTLHNELTESGIEFGDGVRVTLSAPSPSGALSSEQFEFANKQLAATTVGRSLHETQLLRQ